MKIRAFILSLIVLAYIGEGFTIPIKPKEVCSKKMMCCKMKMKEHKKAPEKSGDCGSDGCINCPLINSFTIPVASNTIIIIHPIIKVFPSINSDIVPGFYRQVWRPPNFS